MGFEEALPSSERRVQTLRGSLEVMMTAMDRVPPDNAPRVAAAAEF
jgi:hypothetical protein